MGSTPTRMAVLLGLTLAAGCPAPQNDYGVSVTDGVVEETGDTAE